MAKQRIRIKLKAYEHNVLDESAEKIVQIAQQTGAAISGPVPLPTRKSRYCVLRGPHVNKKAREHFEIRTHKRIIDVYTPTDTTFENLRNLELSAGVDVEVKNF